VSQTILDQIALYRAAQHTGTLWNNDNYWTTSGIPWDVAVAMGLVSNVGLFTKFAENRDVNSSEEVWSAGGTKTLLTSASTLTISSGSDEDGAGTSTGMLTLTVEGLDSDYNPISEDVTLAGTDTVVTTKSFLRVHRAYGTSAGSAKANVGIITGIATTGSSTQFTIPAAKGQTFQSQYCVPADHTLLINAFMGSTGKGTGTVEADFEFSIMLSGTNCWRVVNEQVFLETGTTIAEQTFIGSGGLIIPEKTDIRIVVDLTSGAGVHVNVFYSGYLFKL
jgi:hypothetical protein